MSKPTSMFLGVAVAALTIALAGCNRSTESKAPPMSPDMAEHHGQHADAPAELSESDQALIEKQKVCPVSGEALGSMGTPYKVTVNDRVVFLCCSGCEEELKKNPDKYLAKLPK